MLSLAAPRVLDEIAGDVAKRPSQHRIVVLAGSHDADDANAARFIDQVEDRLVAELRLAANQLRAESQIESGSLNVTQSMRPPSR